MFKHIQILLFSLSISAQEIPKEFFEFQINKLEDDGENWHENTTFGPFRYKHNLKNNEKVNARFGTFIAKNQKMFYAYGHFTFKKYFHGYLYPRIVNNPDDFMGYSGIPRDISRGGFTSGETDILELVMKMNGFTIW